RPAWEARRPEELRQRHQGQIPASIERVPGVRSVVVQLEIVERLGGADRSSRGGADRQTLPGSNYPDPIRERLGRLARVARSLCSLWRTVALVLVVSLLLLLGGIHGLETALDAHPSAAAGDE